jgi:hypothetical protein
MQTVLGINGQDCTIGDGNTVEELEAIAVTLLRAAEAIRNREEGAIECFGKAVNCSRMPTSIIVVRPATSKVRTCLRLSISLVWAEIRSHYMPFAAR